MRESEDPRPSVRKARKEVRSTDGTGVREQSRCRAPMLLGLVENDDTPVLTRLDTDTDTGSVSDSSDMAIAGEKQQRFPQIPTPTNRRNPKIIFVNMVFLVGQGKNFSTSSSPTIAQANQ